MKGVLPDALVARLTPGEVEHYARATNWQLLDHIPGRVRIYRSEREPSAQLLIPDSLELGDYIQAMADAVGTLARVEGRPARELLTELLRTPADTLRYRLDGAGAAQGFLPLIPAVALFAACKRSLLASACTVVQPRSFHPRLSRIEAETFLQRCSLGTERGSFVTTVICPLDAVTEEDADVRQMRLDFPRQLQLFGGVETFARRVVTTLMRSAAAIVAAVKKDSIDGLQQEARDGFVLSSNVCEAFSEMEAVPHAVLHLEASWSRYLPTPQVEHLVTLQRTHFAAARYLAEALRPARPAERRSTFVGLVDSLHGGLDTNDLVGGDIVIRFLQVDDDEIGRAKVSLPPREYQTACDAHKLGHHVAISGTLIPEGPRRGRIVQPSAVVDLARTPAPDADR